MNGFPWSTKNWTCSKSPWKQLIQSFRPPLFHTMAPVSVNVPTVERRLRKVESKIPTLIHTNLCRAFSRSGFTSWKWDFTNFRDAFQEGWFSRENWRKFSTNPVSCIFSQISALYSDKEWSAQSVYHPDNAKPLHNLATSYATTLKSHKHQTFRSKFHLFEKTPLYTDKPLFWKTRKSYLISHRKCQFSDFSIYWL